MNPKETTALIPNPTSGVIRSAAVEDYVAEESSVSEAINVHFDRIGATTVRPGMTAYSAVLSGSPKHLGAWSQSGTTNRQLIAQDGSDIKMLISGTWTTKHTNASSARIRTTQMNNQTFFVNGNANDNPGKYDGTTYSSGVGSLPKGDFINGGFEKRIWVGDKSTSKVYYTDQIPVGSPITGGTEFIYFNAENGQEMTGLFISQKALLVFFQNNIFRIYGATSSDPYPAYYIGTYSQDSILKAKDGIYFHHSSGFYKFNYDSQPQEISRPIIDFVQAIPRASYDTIFGWSDDDHMYWHAGNVTIDGVTHKNLVFRYTISTQIWTIYSYFGAESSTRTLTCALVYDDGTNLNQLVGVSDGNVARANYGTTDLGDPIYYSTATRWLSLTQSQSIYNQLKSLSVIHHNGAGSILSGQVDKNLPNEWVKLGTFDDKYVTLFQSINTNLNAFNRVKLRISGVSTGTPPVFGTMEVLNYEQLGYTYQ